MILLQLLMMIEKGYCEKQQHLKFSQMYTKNHETTIILTIFIKNINQLSNPIVIGNIT